MFLQEKQNACTQILGVISFGSLGTFKIISLKQTFHEIILMRREEKYTSTSWVGLGVLAGAQRLETGERRPRFVE